MTRVYLDLSRLVFAAWSRTPTGIPRVELAYAQYFAAHFPQQLEFVVVDALGRFSLVDFRTGTDFVEAIARYWQSDVRSTRHYARIVAKALLLHAQLLAQRWGSLRRRVRRRTGPGVYVIASQLHMERAALQAIKQAGDLRLAYLVHDVLPAVLPEYFPPAAEKRCRQRMQRAAQSADVIIAVSGETATAFERTFGTGRKPIVVAPLGIVSPRVEAQGPAAAAPYFVILGTIEPRKNHLFLLTVWRSLRARLGYKAPHLVLIGGRGWENENVVDILERSVALRHVVSESNRHSDEETARILKGARALLLPSFAEGFGLPLAEALALGVPVICSDIPVFREVGGAVPEFLDPLDGLGWLQAVLDYLPEDSPRRAAQLARLEGWQAPTWEEHFRTITPHLLEAPARDGQGPKDERA